MKKAVLFLILVSSAASINAQNPKYTSTMAKNISILDTARGLTQLQNLANTFERIAGSEKTEWLPNYYVAYCYAKMSQNTKGNIIDTYCDKADKFIHKADSIDPNNSEIYTVKAQIASARIGVNTIARGQKYGALSATLLDKAKKLDPSNPRPWLVEGEAKFFTPPAFGGGKKKAKTSFEKAVSLFKAFKPVSSIHPYWGKAETNYFLKQCEE